MKVLQDHKGCRFWGYEPASAEFLHKPMDRAKKDAIREKNKADRAAIKASGRKPDEMGFRTKEAAKQAASQVEAATGVEMMVFNHDYL